MIVEMASTNEILEYVRSNQYHEHKKPGCLIDVKIAKDL